MNASSLNSGYLEIILGPMFSGKTSKLLEIYKQCNFCDIPVSIVNHSCDTRYHETMVSNHDKVMAPCLQCSELNQLWTSDNQELVLKKANVILINEGQFFPDLYEVVTDMLQNGKTIYISGLDGDFERKNLDKCLI